METSVNLPGAAELAIWLLVACGAAYVAWYFRKDLFSRPKIMLSVAAALPWLMAAWFLLAVVGCLGAASRIGAGSTDIPMFLVVGGFGFPAFLPLPLYLRKLIRRRYSPRLSA